MGKTSGFAIGLGVILACAQLAHSVTVTVGSTGTGGFASNGAYSNTPPGNYFTGSSASPSALPDRRSFFVFDIPPFAEPVSVAKLKLFLPGPPSAPSGFISDDAFETFRISDTGTHSPAHIVTPGLTTAEAIAIHGTLGTGSLYGSGDIFPAMAGTDITFTLTPGAVASINASLGSLWSMGARLTTLDGSSIDELVFGYSDLAAPYMAGLSPRLEMTTVPEPSAAGALLLGAGALLRRHTRRI